MSESLFENNFSIELKNSLSEDSVRIEVDYAKEYREYKNTVLVKSISIDDDDLLLILLENRLLDLQREGFVCAPPPCKPACSIVPSVEKITELETDDELDYLIGDAGEIYLKVYEMDMVSLHDVYARLCAESGIAELQLPTERLNCVHVGKLRHFFYQPEATRLSCLVIDCGFDSLSGILHILRDADALHLPVSLNLICECDANHQNFQETDLLQKLNLQQLTCQYNEHLPLFFESISKVVRLSLWNKIFDKVGYFHKSNAQSGLSYLHNRDLPSLQSLSFLNVSNQDELDQLLNLPCIGHLETLLVTGSEYASANLPVSHLLDESVIAKWQHLKQFFLDGHYVYEDVRKLFAKYPQVHFY
jgi:hypothetical protein